MILVGNFSSSGCPRPNLSGLDRFSLYEVCINKIRINFPSSRQYRRIKVELKGPKRLMKQLATANTFHPAMRLGRGSERAVNFKKNRSSGPEGRPGPVGLNVDVIKG